MLIELSMACQRSIALVTGLVLAALTSSLNADEFLLRHGARVEGTWLNRSDEAAQHYVLQTQHGIRLAVPRAQVVDVRGTDSRAAYDRLAPTFQDTVEEQWELAKWCRQHKLPEQRRLHLRRVLQLDTDHVKARHALGYSQVGGRWMLPDEAMRERGFVQHRGRWMLPQEVELQQERVRVEAAERKWFVDLKRWRQQLGTKLDAQAQSKLGEVRDPDAIRALTRLLDKERQRSVRMLLVNVLGRIHHDRATAALIRSALNDRDEEIFHTCVDQLLERNSPDVVAAFAGALRDSSNRRVNRAAQALSRLGDDAAIPPLIDALVTTHYHVRPTGNRMTLSFQHDLSMTTSASDVNQQMGQLGHQLASFMPRGTGMSYGRRGPDVTPYQVANRQVLDALVTVSGGASFGFNKQAWTNWHVLQQQYRVGSYGPR